MQRQNLSLAVLLESRLIFFTVLAAALAVRTGIGA